MAKAFDMHVVGIKRDIANHDGIADKVHPPGALEELLPKADYVVLASALNAETEGLINRKNLGLMSPHSVLVNVARGRCVVDILVKNIENIRQCRNPDNHIV